MLEFSIFYYWLGFTIAVGLLAHNHRGRSAPGWVILSLFISPLLAGVLLLCLPRLDATGTRPSEPSAKITWRLDARRADDIARIQGIVK
jgi:hypothetical protein